MTKAIRIENADSGTHFSPVIEVQNVNAEGEWVTVEKYHLPHPTNLKELMIWGGRRLIIREFDSTKDVALKNGPV